MPSNALYRTPESVMNALSGPQGPLGMDPNVNRLSLLPRYNQRDGLVAPQWLYDLARAAEAPGNALMGRTTPEDAVNFGMNFAGAGLGTSAAMKAPAPGPGKTIAATVYHGSPHDFDAFDMSKIGTGEGAQAYGHGLYVAESPGVAKNYAEALGQSVKIGDKSVVPSTFNRSGDVDADVATALSAYGLDVDKAIAATAERLANAQSMKFPEGVTSRRVPQLKATLERLQEIKAQGVPVGESNSGKLYTVDLPDSAIANMLDWDAPLSQQPEIVKQAFQKAYTDRLAGLKRVKTKDGSLAWTAKDGDGSSLLYDSKLDYFAKTGKLPSSASGRDLYQRLSFGGGYEQSTNALKPHGVTGVKYLDGGSRGAGTGTRNFVVFDDKLLNILNKE